MANYWKGSSALVPIPTGCILPFLGANVPDGWLLLDGSSVVVADYPELAAALGIASTAYSFVLPDMRGRTVWGADTTYPVGSTIVAGLPNIVGISAFGQGGTVISANSSGALSGTVRDGTHLYGQLSGTAGEERISFDASRSNSIYGASDTVQPPALSVNFIIKT